VIKINKIVDTHQSEEQANHQQKEEESTIKRQIVKLNSK
jgi:hypothetical protein